MDNKQSRTRIPTRKSGHINYLPQSKMSNEILDVDLAGASPFVGQDSRGLINIVVLGFGVTKPNS